MDPTYHCPYPLKNLFPFVDFAKMRQQYATHFYIVHDQAIKNLDWIKKLSLEDLNRADPVYGLTPLHLAVIKGNQVIAKCLFEKGVSLTAIDRYKYTILHHATICQNKEMLAWIKTADKTSQLQSLKTNEGKTAADLEKILSYQPLDSNAPAFNYLDSTSGQIIYKAPATKFKEMTGALYTEHTITTPQALIQNWLSKSTVLEEIENDQGRLNYIQQLYAQYKISPPVLYIAQNADAKVGLGVFTEEEIAPYQIVFLYHGEQISTPPKNASYLLDEKDGKNIRNLGPMVNDGFPNLICLPFLLNDEAGVSQAFITTRKILKNEQLSFNYGFNHQIKWDPHQELNSKELEEFFLSRSPKEYFQDMLKKAKEVNRKDELDILKFDICIGHLRYVFNTPSAIFYLATKNIVNTQECIELLSNPTFLSVLNISSNPLKSLLNGFQNIQKKMEINGLSAKFNEFTLNYFKCYKTRHFHYILILLNNYQPTNEEWNESSKELMQTAQCLDSIYDQLSLFDFKTLSNDAKKEIILLFGRVPEKYRFIILQKFLEDMKVCPEIYNTLLKEFKKNNLL